ncbi:DUF998 domain-containing protein [Nakamurella sp. A5-74]|uniref:DUF998 domain-containing protein n=1 Tax=Nakamurella sp. A5-74 TaxID=3158264 RepID=A0AAU8DMW5_9ACTN
MTTTTRNHRIPTRAGTVSTAAALTADRVTKSLLGYGVIAGPVYLLTSLLQAATRDGFDVRRHAWSQLSLGDRGWIQTTNFVLSGLMVIAFAAGLRRALSGGAAVTWAPRLIAVFGLSLVTAGVFRVDPAAGFPVGTPQTGVMSTSALVHFAAGGVGFTALAVALLVLAGRLSGEGFEGLALACRIVAPLFLLTFVGMASGLLGAAGIPAFTLGVVGVLILLSALAVHRYRQMPDTAGR